MLHIHNNCENKRSKYVSVTFFKSLTNMVDFTIQKHPLKNKRV